DQTCEEVDDESRRPEPILVDTWRQADEENQPQGKDAEETEGKRSVETALVDRDTFLLDLFPELCRGTGILRRIGQVTHQGHDPRFAARQGQGKMGLSV